MCLAAIALDMSFARPSTSLAVIEGRGMRLHYRSSYALLCEVMAQYIPSPPLEIFIRDYEKVCCTIC